MVVVMRGDDSQRTSRSVAPYRIGASSAYGAVLFAIAVIASSACSFGLYDDTGKVQPGQWWPWVCPDAGDALAPEAGCEPPKCPDGGTDGHADGGC